MWMYQNQNLQFAQYQQHMQVPMSREVSDNAMLKPGHPNTQSPEEGVNFKIATVEEADSLFDQAALGQKY